MMPADSSGGSVSWGLGPPPWFSTKKPGVGELADVVIVAAHPREQPVRADDVAGGLAQVGHRQAVGPGARSLERQATQQRTAEIGELEQREIGRDPGAGFGERHHDHGE